VTDEATPHPVPRARPVADLPLEDLIGRSEELARAWAVALIVTRAPSAIAEIPLEDLARDGPRLCVQMLRALGSDAELERLTEPLPEGGREELAAAAGLASLAGARGVASVIAALEALRGVLWEELLGELRRPVFERADAHLLADLADRLSYVCAMALAAALPAALEHDPAAPGRGQVVVAGIDSPLVRAYAGSSEPRRESEQSRREPEAPHGERPAAGPERGGDHGEVVIIDERPHAPSSPRVVVARERRAAGRTDVASEPAPQWDPPPSQPEPAWHEQGPAPARDFSRPVAEPVLTDERPAPGWDPPMAAAPPAPSQIEIRDERVEEGPAAWIRLIGRELERYAHDAHPFAVLLVELMDVERLNRSELSEVVLRLASQVQRALESELRTISDRPAGSLTREAPGRFWLVAPQIDALRVRALAEQIGHAVRRSVSHRGRPVEVAVGMAVCPDDGLQAAALAAHADVALYAARTDGSAGGGDAAR
jgi:GGDEF domain-containing protein